MAKYPDPHNPGPVPITPKKKLPGEDASFPGQPPNVDIDDAGEDPGDRGEGGHVESAEHVDRELPAGKAGARR